MPSPKRLTRMQVMLSEEEMAVVDNFRFEKHMPSRAAAVREILRRGLAAVGFARADAGTSSKQFGVIGDSGQPKRSKAK